MTVTEFYSNATADDDTMSKRPDSNRTHHARSLSVERRGIRKQYSTNGGRW